MPFWRCKPLGANRRARGTYKNACTPEKKPPLGWIEAASDYFVTTENQSGFAPAEPPGPGNGPTPPLPSPGEALSPGPLLPGPPPALLFLPAEKAGDAMPSAKPMAAKIARSFLIRRSLPFKLGLLPHSEAERGIVNLQKAFREVRAQPGLLQSGRRPKSRLPDASGGRAANDHARANRGDPSRPPNSQG